MLTQLAETISKWFAPIIRMWRFTKNNGITEGFHRKMKLIQRRAYGYRNFENYRLRVLVECGVNLWKANLKNQPIPQPLVLTRRFYTNIVKYIKHCKILLKKYFVNGTQKIFNAKNALCSFATSKVKICLRCTLDCFQFSDISRRRPKYALRGISTRIFHRALKLKRRAPFFNYNNI